MIILISGSQRAHLTGQALDAPEVGVHLPILLTQLHLKSGNHLPVAFHPLVRAFRQRLAALNRPVDMRTFLVSLGVQYADLLDYIHDFALGLGQRVSDLAVHYVDIRPGIPYFGLQHFARVHHLREVVIIELAKGPHIGDCTPGLGPVVQLEDCAGQDQEQKCESGHANLVWALRVVDGIGQAIPEDQQQKEPDQSLEEQAVANLAQAPRATQPAFIFLILRQAGELVRDCPACCQRC